MIKKYLTLYILLYTSLVSYGQSVDMLTGRAQVSIPLFSLNYGGLSIPVGISHHGSSIKVKEGEGTCGLGWNLAAGGAVSRITRGLPDDYSTNNMGWLYNSNAQQVQDFISMPDDDLSTCSDETSAFNFLTGRDYDKDTEPDLFYVSAPGLNFQFVFGADGQPKLLNYQDLTITVTRPSGTTITQFIVQTPAGLIYTFNVTEDVTRKAVLSAGQANAPDYYKTNYQYYSGMGKTFSESWNLSTITSLSSNTVATFNYTTGEQAFTSQEFWPVYTLDEEHTTKKLTSINIGNPATISSISFSWNGNRLINVKLSENSSGQSKEYSLLYYGVYYVNDTYPHLTRYFLRELKPVVNCIPFPSYQFSYHLVDYTSSTVSVPFTTGDFEDPWGYFTDGTNSSTIFFSDQLNAYRYRITPPANATGGQTVGANFRYTESGTQSIFGALAEISNPEGGVTKIAYESNTYFDAVTGNPANGAGIRVKKITTYAGEQAYGRSASAQSASYSIEKEYEYVLSGSSATSGKLTYPVLLAFSTGSAFVRSKVNLGEPSEVLYSRAAEKIAGKGKTIYEFDIPGMYPATTDGDWKATKSMIARSSCISAGNLKNGSYTYPFPPHTNYSFERGRLNKVQVLAEDGTLLNQRIVTYSRNPSSPTIVYGIRFERTGDIFHFGKYEIWTGVGSVVTQEVTQQASEQTPSQLNVTTMNYTYGGQPLLLQETSTTLQDGSITKQKYKYARDFTITNPLGDAATAIQQFNSTGRKSAIVETTSYLTPIGGTEYVAGASAITYKNFSGYYLPYQTFSFQNTSGFTEAVATTVGSQQRLDIDTDYRLIKTIENYTAAGQPLDETDDRKNRASFHYSTNQALGPVASFAQSKARQSVYEGFETNTGYGLTISGNPSPAYETGWTGEKALQLTSSMTLANTNVEKNSETLYRVSCWVKAAQTSVITFQARNGANLVSGSPVALSYGSSSVNQWTYLEGTMNVANANATFSVEVVTNAAIAIDDILAIPLNAGVSLATYSALNGVTSQSDDQGNSVKQTYDLIGRKVSTLDRNRNLVARNEYQTLKQPVVALVAGIQSNTEYYVTGVPVTFTAGTNCQSGLSYEWKFYWSGSQPVVSTSSTLNYTFTQPGYYELGLTVSHPQYGSAFYSKAICVELNPAHQIILTVENVSGLPDPYLIKECYDTYTKRFTISNMPVCTEADSEVGYGWARYNNSTGDWTPLSSINPSGNYSGPVIEFTVSANDIIRCIAGTRCGPNLIPQCSAANPNYQILTASFTFVPAQGGCP